MIACDTKSHRQRLLFVRTLTMILIAHCNMTPTVQGVQKSATLE